MENVYEYQGTGTVCERLTCGGKPFLDADDDGKREAWIRSVSGVSPQDAEAYFETVRAAGAKLISDRETEGNRFLCFRTGNGHLYLTYTAAGVLRVVDDPCTENEETFSSDPPDSAAEGEGQFFLYGLNMDPGGYNPNGKEDSYLNTSGLPNCGQILVLRCPDQSVIFVDGGCSSQWKNGALERLDAFLHQITGTLEDAPVRISCWFLTHFHNDHTDGFYELLRAYPERYAVERIFCNLPRLSDFGRVSNEPVIRAFAGFLKKTNPACRELTAHTGQVLRIGGVTLQVFHTFEDEVDPATGELGIKDSNDTSTVVRASVPGMSLMILGDIHRMSEKTMLLLFPGEALRSDMVQVAHHNFNRLEVLYGKILAPIAWFTQTEAGVVKNETATRNSDEVRKYAAQCYFAGDATRTVGFACREGQIRVIYRDNRYWIP